MNDPTASRWAAAIDVARARAGEGQSNLHLSVPVDTLLAVQGELDRLRERLSEPPDSSPRRPCEYRPGDRVRVVKLDDDSAFANIRVGMEFTVSSVSRAIRVSVPGGDCWFFDEWQVEMVEPSPAEGSFDVAGELSKLRSALSGLAALAELDPECHPGTDLYTTVEVAKSLLSGKPAPTPEAPR